MTTQFVSKLRKAISTHANPLILTAGLLTASLSPVFVTIGIAHADINNTRADASGTLELGGSSWLSGGGVNVYSNGNSASNDSGANCVAVSGAPGDSHCSAGNVWSGEKWQCVEMVNRLYLTSGWTTATWSGNGNTLVNSVPSNLAKENDGSITYLNPGDVITLDDGVFGHAGIINTVGGTIQIVNQNTIAVYSSASLQSGTSFGAGNADIDMSGWAGYNVQAVIHHPSTTTNKPVGNWDGGSKTLPAVFRPSNGTWYYHTSSGTVSQSYGLSGDIPTPGYYSGSTKPDYAVFRPSNSTWYYMTQSGSTASQAFGQSGDIPVPGDYGGEGHTEYAVFRPSNSTWYWFTSSGTVTQAFGQSGDIPVPAKWDGGAKTEPGVFRPSNGTWYYLTPTGTVSQSYGLSGDIPEPGYYSNSTKPDFGVFRPSNSTWYFMPQGGAGNSQSFGLSGDLPVPGSYSGASKEDFGVFRPSNTTWYWLPQGGSSNSQVFGSSGDIPAVSTLPYPILQSLGLMQ